MGSQQKSGAASLDDLIAKSDGVGDGELAAALVGRISVIPDSERVQFQGTLKSASGPKKLVAAGLARHVLHRKGVLSEATLPADSEWYANQAQQKPKTIGEQLSRLKKAGLMDRNSIGWFIPLWALEQAVKFIEE